VGLDATGDGLDTDRHYRTAVDRVYAVGRLALPNRSQAIISAGAGAIAALDVLSREAGKDVHDWESPESAT
jgi:thioredoxin reductase (NADPH)